MIFNAATFDLSEFGGRKNNISDLSDDWENWRQLLLFCCCWAADPGHSLKIKRSVHNLTTLISISTKKPKSVHLLKTSRDGEEADKSEVRQPPQDAPGESGGENPADLHFIRIHLQTAAPLVSVQSTNTGWLFHPQSLHLHLNNKLKAVKFPHCDYQSNCIIEVKTELASCKMCYQNAGADITERVPQCARRLRIPEFKDFCEILGCNEKLVPCPPLK